MTPPSPLWRVPLSTRRAPDVVAKRIATMGIACLLASCALLDTKTPVPESTAAMPVPGVDVTMASSIRSGAYAPSSFAVGEARDLVQRRGAGPGPVRADALESQLQSMRARLLAASGIADVPGRTRLLADRSLLAFSTPDGNVFVSFAWLDAAVNEDEVAAVVARELAHILLGHHDADVVARWRKRTLAFQLVDADVQRSFGQLVDAPASSAATPAAVAQSVAKSDSGSKLFDALSVGETKAKASAAEAKGASVAQKTAGTTDGTDKRALRRAQWFIDVTDKAVVPTYTALQERDADLLGVDLLVQARFDKGAMSAMLRRSKDAEDRRASEDRDRQGQLALVANDLGVGAKNEASRIALSEVLVSLAEPPPSIAVRIEAVDGYVAKFHRERDARNADADSWKRARNDATTTAIVANYGKAFAAEQAIRKGDVKTASRLAKQAASGATGNEGYPNWIAALAFEANIATNDARAYFQKAIGVREPINAAYEAYVSSLERSGQYTSALAESEKASKVFGDVPTWLVTRIRLSRKLGDASAAKKLETQCATETPDHRRACGEAGNTPLPGKPGSTAAMKTR